MEHCRCVLHVGRLEASSSIITGASLNKDQIGAVGLATPSRVWNINIPTAESSAPHQRSCLERAQPNSTELHRTSMGVGAGTGPAGLIDKVSLERRWNQCLEQILNWRTGLACCPTRRRSPSHRLRFPFTITDFGVGADAANYADRALHGD